jgi:SAM-dependent methyltransferase
MNRQAEDSTKWLERNRERYNASYSTLDPAGVARKVRDYQRFLDDATQTDTSWVGLYGGRFAGQLAQARVLELGPGNGLNALIMAALGAEVVAVDISSRSIEILHEASRELGFTNRIEAIVGDFATLAFPAASFDFVVGKAFLHHLTTEQEVEYVATVARILRRTGEARFVEPAVNSPTLDALRWIIPVPGRPSLLDRKAFTAYLSADVHPRRDNSSRHYRDLGRMYFEDVEIVPIGSLERFHRLLPRGEINRLFRRWAFRVERFLPYKVRCAAARTQTIKMRKPRRGHVLP